MQPHTYSLTPQTICDILGVLACITDELPFFVEAQEWSLVSTPRSYPDMSCLRHQHNACLFVPFYPFTPFCRRCFKGATKPFFFMPNKPVSITTSKTVLLVDQLLSVGCSNSFKPRARTALASTASFPKRLCSFPWWLLHVSTWASTSHSSLVALHPSLPVALWCLLNGSREHCPPTLVCW